MNKTKQPSPDFSAWKLTSGTAELRTSQLSGRIDLRNPLRGLHRLTYNATVVEGSVLGVAMLGEDASLEEAFVRGDDLVATYRADGDRPFSLQVYWTIALRENGVFLDTLLSLETPLLESFPKVIVKSQLQGVEVLQQNQDHEFLILRSIDNAWSYAEMAHPADPVELQIDEKGVLQRSLGGAFLEKGVIRRLRLRGVFLPRDLQNASECLAELVSEAPPLTA